MTSIANRPSQPASHPIFQRFRFSVQPQPRGWHVEGLGVRTDASFMDMSKWHVKVFTPCAEPAFDENYFEWIDLLSAVTEAKGKFVMAELGAGYAPWLVCAAVALRQINGPPCHLIAVEAEPTRFAWITRHFQNNGIDPKPHNFVRAAIAAEDAAESAWFLVGDPKNTYGASIQPEHWVPTIISHRWVGVRATIRRMLRRLLGRQRPQKVPTIALSTLLQDVERVDLLDLDIQGAEWPVLQSAIPIVNKKVRRIHIGTHGADIEAGLRNLFSTHQWTKIFDYASGSTAETPYGRIDFQDGVQSWLNPRLEQN